MSLHLRQETSQVVGGLPPVAGIQIDDPDLASVYQHLPVVEVSMHREVLRRPVGQPGRELPSQPLGPHGLTRADVGDLLPEGGQVRRLLLARPRLESVRRLCVELGESSSRVLDGSHVEVGREAQLGQLAPVKPLEGQNPVAVRRAEHARHSEWGAGPEDAGVALGPSIASRRVGLDQDA